MSKLGNFPKSINGDRIVSLKNANQLRHASNMDPNWGTVQSLGSWYQDEAKDLGMVELVSNFAPVSRPLYKNFFKEGKILEVNGINGLVKYQTPVMMDTSVRIMKDSTDELGTDIGAYGSTFHVYINIPLNPGDTLTHSLRESEYDLIVTESTKASVSNEGAHYKTYVRIVTQNADATWDNKYLKVGTRYTHHGQKTGVEGTNLGAVSMMHSMGSLEEEFMLGNMGGVEMGGNVGAHEKSVKLNGVMLQAYRDQTEANMKDGLAMNTIVISEANRVTKKLDVKVIGQWGRFFVMSQYIKNESMSNLFSKGGFLPDLFGGTYINEGLWHQFDRGRVIYYGRPDGIKLSHLEQAANYVFQGSDIPMDERKLNFVCGGGAFKNGERILAEASVYQLGRVRKNPADGDVSYLPSSPITGPLDAMEVGIVRFKKAFLPSIGWVEFEHDPSLDMEPNSDPYSRGYNDNMGAADSTYTMAIWDLTDSKYSNARTALPSGAKIAGPASPTNNIWYVRPGNRSFWWGKDNGRYASDPNVEQITSSRPNFDESFWAWGSSAILMLNKSLSVKIRLPRR